MVIPNVNLKISNMDQLKSEVKKATSCMNFLAKRGIILIPEDIKSDVIVSRLAKYVQSNMKIDTTAI